MNERTPPCIWREGCRDRKVCIAQGFCDAGTPGGTGTCEHVWTEGKQGHFCSKCGKDKPYERIS